MTRGPWSGKGDKRTERLRLKGTGRFVVLDGRRWRRTLTDEDLEKLNKIMSFQRWKFRNKRPHFDRWDTMLIEDAGCIVDDLIKRLERERPRLKEHLKKYSRAGKLRRLTYHHDITSNVRPKRLTRQETIDLIKEYRRMRCEMIEKFYELEELLGEKLCITIDGKKKLLKRHKRCSRRRS